MSKFLIIQTAFIGDVILATAVAEKLAVAFPKGKIDFLVRKGNETLLQNNTKIGEVLVWDKEVNKLRNLFSMRAQVQSKKYDYIINLHRFASSGFITGFSGAKNRIGFKNNPFSFRYTKSIEHRMDGVHETERNHQLIAELSDAKVAKPRLYPSDSDFKSVKQYKRDPYICIAPNSVWFTKQLPMEKWVEVLTQHTEQVYLLGGPEDKERCEELASTMLGSVVNLAGELSFLETAALMQDAKMNYVNDSAPLHIASAMDAPVTAIFCSTVPEFGFGPLSSRSKVVQVSEDLDCRPCGLHGHATCPKGHFDCALKIDIDQIVSSDG